MIYHQKWFGKIIAEQYAELMRAAHENISGWGDECRIDQDSEYTGIPKELTVQKDLWALELLATVGDCVVFDCDLIPLKKFEFNKPGAYTIYEWGTPRIGMAASVGDEGRRWWANRIKNKIERKIHNVHGFTNKLFRPEWLTIDGLPIEIPADYYDHKRLTSGTIN